MKIEKRSKITTLRLTEKECKTLNSFLEQHKIKSKSSLIRQLLENHIF